MTQATEKDIGKWCIFKTNFFNKTFISKLENIDNDGYSERKHFAYKTKKSIRHTINCTPLTQEQIKCLGLEV